MADNGVKFVRIRGRVVPIKSKQGQTYAKQQIKSKESKAKVAFTVSNLAFGAAFGAQARSETLMKSGAALRNKAMFRSGLSFNKIGPVLFAGSLATSIYGHVKASQAMRLRIGSVGKEQAIKDIKKENKGAFLQSVAEVAAVPLAYLGLRKIGPGLASAASSVSMRVSKVFKKPIHVGRGSGINVPRKLLK